MLKYQPRCSADLRPWRPGKGEPRPPEYYALRNYYVLDVYCRLRSAQGCALHSLSTPSSASQKRGRTKPCNSMHFWPRRHHLPTQPGYRKLASPHPPITPAMSGLPFIKMHGLGNDFVVIDARERPLALTDAASRAIADRRTGVGCDQLIVHRAAACWPAPTPSCASATPTAARSGPAATPRAASRSLLMDEKQAWTRGASTPPAAVIAADDRRRRPRHRRYGPGAAGLARDPAGARDGHAASRPTR